MAFDSNRFGMDQLPQKKKVTPPQSAYEQASSLESAYNDPAPEVAEVEEITKDPIAEATEEVVENDDNPIPPEAVCYRTADKQCSSCKYFEENEDMEGNCSKLKMPVEQDAGCNLHVVGNQGAIDEESLELPSDSAITV